jgi:hypothetical protein
MIVTQQELFTSIQAIMRANLKGYDTETYGVRFQDRLFSVIISVPEETFYFNFKSAPDHKGMTPAPSYILDRRIVFPQLKEAMKWGVWASHNAKFDNQKMELEDRYCRPVHCHCTLATERLIRNDELDYSLEQVAKTYGLEKDMSVDEYITKNKLYTFATIPGKKNRVKIPHYDQVPFDIMVRYGCKDAELHRKIAGLQRLALGI